MGKIFGVTQSHYGAECRWIFTAEELEDQLGFIPEDGETIAFFPLGGSNSSDSYVEELKNDTEIKEFLTTPGYMDYDDPMLSDCGEYYIDLCTDEGSVTGEYLKKFGITNAPQDDAYGTIETVEKIVGYFRDIAYDDFDYSDPYYGEDSDMRVSELIDLYHEVDPKNTLRI